MKKNDGQHKQAPPLSEPHPSENRGEYDWITATVKGGRLYWKYHVRLAERDGFHEHPNLVDNLDDDDIRELTLKALDVREHQKELVVINRE